jgi:hypothetical protein
MSKREVVITSVELTISTLLAVRVADMKERKEQDSANLREFLNSPFREEV